MNDKLKYAEMLDMPVNSVNITYKPKKKRLVKKSVDGDKLKEKVIEKVNSGEVQVKAEEDLPLIATDEIVKEPTLEPVPVIEETEFKETETVSITRGKKIKRKPFKFTVIGVELAVIGLLLATIFITNALLPNSGINTFMKNVFGVNSNTVSVDNRTYKEFNPVLPVDGSSISGVENGVMSFSGKGSVYAPCDGTVINVTEVNGKFDIEIEHNGNFMTVFNGIDFAYAEKGDKVYSNIPVGYVSGGNSSMCFKTGNGEIIQDYKIENSSVVWEK